MKQISSEDPNLHWWYVNVSDKRVFDLGCGDHRTATTLSYPTTLEYFLEQGASFVLGIDLNERDVRSLQSKIASSSAEIKHLTIDSPDVIRHLIVEYQIDIVKSDLEGKEMHLLSLDRETFRLPEQYYIETHGPELYDVCIAKLADCEYNLRASQLGPH